MQSVSISRIIFVISAMLSFASIGAAADLTTTTKTAAEIQKDCSDLVSKISRRTFALEQSKEISELEKTAEKLRQSNGQYERRSHIIRDRKMRFMKNNLASGELSQIVNLFRQEFRNLELAYYTILHHQKKLAELQNMTGDSIATVLQMESELQSAYRDLGENYVDYVVARSYLEQESNSADAKISFQAKYVLRSLGHADISRRFPDLMINPDNRPKLEAIQNIFRTQIEPVVALIKKDIKEERRIQRVKWGFWAVASLQRAVMNIGQLQIGPLKIGGPKLQEFVSLVFLMSRDKYLASEYIHRIEAILQSSPTAPIRLNTLLEMCNSRCDELLETFARLGVLSQDWTQIKEELKSRNNSPQERRLSKLMEKAEGVAEDAGGLSLNYHDLADDRGTQFILSTAATSFWTFVLTQSTSDLANYWDLTRNFVLNLFGG